MVCFGSVNTVSYVGQQILWCVGIYVRNIIREFHPKVIIVKKARSIAMWLVDLKHDNQPTD